MLSEQLPLFGRHAPSVDPGFAGVRRLELGDGAWVDYLPGWVRGHARLFDRLRETTAWESHSRTMYERVVDVPRLTASFDPGTGPGVVLEASACLARRYAAPLDRVTLALYRDGRDSVAWHADKVARDMPRAVIAIVSLGEPRRFLMRPRHHRGRRSISFRVGWGDLLVMGGTTQRFWEHGVPKVGHAGPRMSVMFRHGDHEPEDR